MVKPFGLPGAGQTLPVTVVPSPSPGTVSAMAVEVPNTAIAPDPTDLSPTTPAKKHKANA